MGSMSPMLYIVALPITMTSGMILYSSWFLAHHLKVCDIHVLLVQ